MPRQLSVTQVRLNNIATCLTITADTLEMLAHALKIPFLEPMCNTTQSLLKYIGTVKQNKSDCADLMEKTHNLLNAIIILYIKSDTGTDLTPIVLKHMGRFTETLHKIHTFVDAQQDNSTVKRFFRRGEMSTLLNDCKIGVQHALEFFQIHALDIMTDTTEIQENAQKRHQEVLCMIEALSEATSTDGASTVRKIHCVLRMPIALLQISRLYSGSYNSSKSISMLPSKPKIFHGRDSELSEILKIFSQVTPRIAILGAGGMGKTSLARAVLHHIQITGTYEQHRFFVPCDSATTKVELAALIGAHLGLKPDKDLTHPVVQYFSSSPPSLLILDNLETLWEPAESRDAIEEFLSLLTDVDHLALMITMRGSERPVKVAWTRPFLPPLKPLEKEAAYNTFIDIADNGHHPEDVDQVLSLTDNMPLAISLLAHLADSEGCTAVLSRWEEERTSMVSDGFDKRSNLDLSISLSLSSPRINYLPHSRDLLSLLSMLPDGLSDAELVQSRLPIDNILGCKAALIRTSLAYTNEQKQLKALVPVREYVRKTQPPGDHLVQPLLKHFQELLEFFVNTHGTQSTSGIVPRISSNFANIQNVLQNGLQLGHPQLKDSIYCVCQLNAFSRLIGLGPILLIDQLHNVLVHLRDYHLEACFVVEMLSSWRYHPISNQETIVSPSFEHFEQVDDPDLKCMLSSISVYPAHMHFLGKLYFSAADYYQACKDDLSNAINLSQRAVSLAISTGNTQRHAQGLRILARFNWILGDSSAALMYAHESQRLARISANFYMEASALNIKAICLDSLGDYKQAISLCNRARDLLGLCGASGGQLDHALMSEQAEIHKLKSEYVEARNIQCGLLKDVPKDRDPFTHALILLNIAEIDVSIGAPEHNVQKNIEASRKQFSTMGHVYVIACEVVLADLYMREGNIIAAESLLKKCLKPSTVQREITPNCLEQLGDFSRWNVSPSPSSWTTVYFVYSLKFKEKLGIHKALQFLGDIFLFHNDEETAISLYTVALEGFTYMDVHRSRAECLLRLGDISKGHDDLLEAVELWETARPLLERSSQAKQVENIDRRLASVAEDVLEQHKQNMACLAELNAPSGTVKELEDEESDIEDLEVDLDKAQNLNPVAS